MTDQTASTRRAFLKGGAILAAPLTAATAAHAATDPAAERLALLEDEKAVRGLQAALVQRLNAGAHDAAAELFAEPQNAAFDPAVRRVTTEADAEFLEVQPGRTQASARLAVSVATEAPVEPWCPLVDMARQQGEGVVRAAGRRVLETDYVKRDGVWKIARAELRAV